MKKLCSVVVLLWMKNEICLVTGSNSCCGYENDSNQDYFDVFTEEYRIAEANDELEVLTETIVAAQETVTEMRTTSSKNKSYQNLCNGDNRVTSVYERTRDVDMKFVQDSITSMWRIIFSLVFILILLAFLISYVYSLVKNNNSSKNTNNRRNERNRNVPDTFADKTAQLYFPVINASRTAHFLKDLDPIYDYPCSVQSDYEKV